MLTPKQFRALALQMDGAIEGAHMGQPDFRVGGRIFATLHAGGKTGMVKVTPEFQNELIKNEPAAFSAASGAWGRQGCTIVELAKIDEDTLGQAMTVAWQNTKKQSTVNRKKKS